MAPILTMTSTFVGVETDRNNWNRNEWQVVLSLHDDTLTVPYHMDVGIAGAPKLSKVLTSLVLSYQAATGDVLDYLAEHPRDISDEVERDEVRQVWNALVSQADRMYRFFCDYIDNVCETDWEHTLADNATEVNLADI